MLEATRHLASVDGEGSDGSGQPPVTATRAASKKRASRALPTDRIKFENQVEGLRAYGRLSGSAQRPVRAKDLGVELGLAETTAGLLGGFLEASGFLERQGRGEYKITSAMVEYRKHVGLAPDDERTARSHLARSVMAESWYWPIINTRLEDGSAKRQSVIFALAEAADGHDYLPNLNVLLEWTDWLGLTYSTTETVTVNDDRPQVARDAPEDKGCEAPTDTVQELVSEPQSATLAAGAVSSETANAPVFVFDLRVSMTAKEMEEMNPEKFAAVMALLARVSAPVA